MLLTWAEAHRSRESDGTLTAAAKAEVPEGLTLAMNLLWEAQAERTDQVQAIQADLRELVQRRQAFCFLQTLHHLIWRRQLQMSIHFRLPE